MKLSNQVKPVSCPTTHPKELPRNKSENGEPPVITQNGEAKATMVDVKSYEQTQEAITLLKMLALGMIQMEEGKAQPAGHVIQRLRKRSKSKGTPAGDF